VALVGWARSAEQDQVLSVEMEFTNADNSWAGSDFRNVDLSIDNRGNDPHLHASPASSRSAPTAPGRLRRPL
jgi:hypothetical protein